MEKLHTKFQYTKVLALQRDNATCQECGIKGEDMEVHHIIPKRNGGTDNLENLVTLCVPCHRKIEPKKYKQRKKYHHLTVESDYGKAIISLAKKRRQSLGSCTESLLDTIPEVQIELAKVRKGKK